MAADADLMPGLGNSVADRRNAASQGLWTYSAEAQIWTWAGRPQSAHGNRENS